jgi:hypothetical protein
MVPNNSTKFEIRSQVISGNYWGRTEGWTDTYTSNQTKGITFLSNSHSKFPTIWPIFFQFSITFNNSYLPFHFPYPSIFATCYQLSVLWLMLPKCLVAHVTCVCLVAHVTCVSCGSCYLCLSCGSYYLSVLWLMLHVCLVAHVTCVCLVAHATCLSCGSCYLCLVAHVTCVCLVGHMRNKTQVA